MGISLDHTCGEHCPDDLSTCLYLFVAMSANVWEGGVEWRRMNQTSCNYPSPKFQGVWPFLHRSDILGSLVECIDGLYFCIWDMSLLYNDVIMIHLTDPKRLYIHAFALYLQTNIIIECLCFRPPNLGKNGSNLTCTFTWSLKTAPKIPRVLGLHRCGCLGDMMDVMWFGWIENYGQDCVHWVVSPSNCNDLII